MLLSIITINYNNKAGLTDTINSVLSQSYRSFEYVVIDGGSTDGSLQVIQQVASQLSYWVSETDKGIYHAMNKGIKQAKGKYLLFLNSGDCLHQNSSLAHLIPHLHNDAVYYTKALCIHRLTGKGYLQHYPAAITINYLLQRSLNHQNCVIKAKLFDTYGCYDEAYQISSFRDFMLRLAKHGETFVYLPKPVISEYDLDGLSSNHEMAKTEWIRAVSEKHPELLPTLIQINKKRNSLLNRAIAKLQRLFIHYKKNYWSVKASNLV